MVPGNKIQPIRSLSKVNIIVTDALGHIFIGFVYSLGRRRRTVLRHLSLAVAWRT